MKTTLGISGTVCLLLALIVPALAGPLDTGDSLYQSGQYPQAVAAFQQAIGQTQGVEQARAYYKLGNALHKMHQNAQALDAYNHARQIDPSLSFASSPAKFQAAVARVGGAGSSGSSGGSAPRAAFSGGLGAGRDPAFQALTSDNVYVDPRLASTVSQPQLEQAAAQSQDNPHTLVKIAVLGSLPGRYQLVGQYAGTLHHDLALGKNGLVVDVLGGPTQGVAVVTTELGESQNAQLAQQYAPQIASDPTAGTAALAQAVAGSINNKEYRSTSLLWIVFLIVVIIVAFLLLSASRRRKQNVALSREPVDALRANVLSGIEYLDNYADVLPKNNPDSDQVRAFRQAADGKYEQAVKILDRATEVTDIQRAQGLLNGAQSDIQQGRRYLDRATGGTGNIPGDDAVRPQPLPESQTQVQAIPANQRGVSFFSSQPAPLGSLVPVTITVNGQSRQVLATPEEAEELRQGRMPQVRAFNVGGRYVPWYEYDQYDPYNDYWRYQNSGWGGFGTGVAAGFIGAELLDDLFAPRGYGEYGGFGYGGYGYGSPWAFSPDNDYYRGFYDAEQQDRAAGAGFGSYDNTGAGAFAMNDGPGYDTQNYDNAGSASFMTDGGGYGRDQS